MKTIYPTKRNNVRKEGVMFTLYVNTIGKKSDEFIKEIFETYAWTRNPRVKKSNYGPFKARKYSLLLEPKDFNKIVGMIMVRGKHVNNRDVHCMKEDKQNIFVIDRIEY